MTDHQALAFYELFVPQARTYELLPPASKGTSLIGDGVRNSLYLSLATRIATICTPLLMREYSLYCHTHTYFTPDHHPYHEFLRPFCGDGWKCWMERQPELGNLLTKAIDLWRVAVEELFFRLTDDAVALRDTFNVVVDSTTLKDIQFGISDPHNGGRTAAILTFTYGQKLVYKPKDLSPDRAWHSFSLWLNHNKSPWAPMPQKIVQRRGYGWVEYIEETPCLPESEQELFFTRFGHLLALLYLMGATDCHRENIIVCGSEPVLVDFETLLHPQPVNDPMPATLRNSVLSTEILPCRYTVAGKQNIYFPGFDEEWETNREEIRKACAEKADIPALSLRKHMQPFSNGFTAMYRFLMTHHETLSDIDAGPLAIFHNCTVRYVHRPTMTYALTLRSAIRRINSAANPNMKFDLMHAYDPPGISDKAANAIHKAEHIALERLDIPYFSARCNEISLRWENGGQLANFFTKPPLELAQKRAQQLSEDDLTQQLELINQALS